MEEEPGRDPAGARGARAMASPDAVSFCCHTCAARLELPAPSSPFHFTLCPRCRRDYLDDSPALPPPPPPLCALPWPPAPFTSSTPPPAPCVSSSWSSFTTARPRTPVSPRTGPSFSSTGPPPATSSGSAASPTAPVPSSYCPERSAACREFRLLCEQRRSSPAVSPLSSPYSTACSSPLLASPPPPPPPPFHHGDGDLLSESFPLTLRSSTAEEATSPPHDLLPPPPPPWLPLASAGTWDEFLFNHSDSDDDSPPQPPPPPPHVSTYHAMLDVPLQVQRGGPQAAAASMAANDSVFEFDTPLQRGGSQAAPPESIAALPTVAVTEAGLDCVVCTDPLPPSASALRLPCGHLYHSHCIVRWLSEQNSCPICRGSIPTIVSATSDIASSSSSSSSQPPGGRRRRSLPVPGGRRIRRICSRLLRNMEIGRDRQTSSSRDRQTNSSGGDVRV
uniref:RING-type domain-containing protein n=1 Tax=Triticum urartu TaxID=4572 RepID=A0A8R7QI79_TRIUA